LRNNFNLKNIRLLTRVVNKKSNFAYGWYLIDHYSEFPSRKSSRRDKLHTNLFLKHYDGSKISAKNYSELAEIIKCNSSSVEDLFRKRILCAKGWMLPETKMGDLSTKTLNKLKRDFPNVAIIH